MTDDELRLALKESRIATYYRLRGGFPIPLAGAVYWLALAYLGTIWQLGSWAMAAFYGSGLIFPMAVLFSKLFGVEFLKDKAAVGSALLPAFISMLLFWSFIPAAVSAAPEMIVLILAVGMSGHWPVIGWTYGRTALYSAHAVARAVLCGWLWHAFPDDRLVVIPLTVAAIYLATVLGILLDLFVLNRRGGRSVAA
ncbi:DUF7010 family protein [Parvularcula maris]|uniref:Uncharacterized protein n=1 Tax=Parvularcula maris TaxID=2965077 RepID=A0A9X2L711_9PROT|nr:hypothetical protein [Parvularcula maris]MCQ8184153.1 hypothetical protein [Parvularcula maris]